MLKPVRQAELRDAIERILGSGDLYGRRRSQRSVYPTIRGCCIFCWWKTTLVNQRVAGRLLEKRGHRVVLAGNGLEALQALERETYDLVLMDVQMPEMDGLEATAKLREMERHTARHQPVVALTARAMKGDLEHCMSAGMDGYLAKPIRPEELDDAARKVRGSITTLPGWRARH